MNDLGDIERVCDIFIFARNVLSTEAIYDQRVSSLENTRVAKLTKSEPLVHPSSISEAFRAWLRDPCEVRLTYVWQRVLVLSLSQLVKLYSRFHNIVDQARRGYSLK